MSALPYQPALEPNRTFGESPFRLEPSGGIAHAFSQPIARSL
jgi:hypothetical protein